MIIVKLMGGLGNQMFQYAFGKIQAEKNKTDLLLDLSFYKKKNYNETARKYQLNYFNISNQVASKRELSKVAFPRYGKKAMLSKIIKLAYCKPKKYTYYNEESFEFKEIKTNIDKYVYFEGYWQSEKHFKDYKDLLLLDFTLKDKINTNTKYYNNTIQKVDSVSIHIRRGDYVSNPKINNYHGTCSIDYYTKAISYILNKIQSPQFFVFSDDLEWAKENINNINNITFVDLGQNVPDVEEMYLMTQCKHNIIANSSFSWWGAWLSSNPNKIVIAPKKWFNNETINTKDLIPEEWVKL